MPAIGNMPDAMMRVGAGHGIGRVDRKNGIMYGTVAAEAGDPKDGRSEEMFVDMDSLHQMAALGNAAAKGIKARFAHPNMSSDGIGNFIGEHRNWRVEGNRLLTDLHLSDVAHAVPGKGDLYEYILDMGENHPDKFGQSVVIRYDEEAMDAERDEDGRAPIRVTQLKALDVVDEGNLTQSFFGMEEIPDFDLRDVPQAATLFLDKLFGDVSPDNMSVRLVEFFDRYYAHRFGDTFSFKGSLNMGTNPETTHAETPETEVPETETMETPETPEEPEASEVAEVEETSEEETEVAETHDAKTEERLRIKGIRKAAAFYNADEASINHLIDGDFSLEEARAALHSKFSKNAGFENVESEPSGKQTPNNEVDEQEAKWAEEWETYQSDLHCTKEEYIETCRRTASGGQLKPKA